MHGATASSAVFFFLYPYVVCARYYDGHSASFQLVSTGRRSVDRRHTSLHWPCMLMKAFAFSVPRNASVQRVLIPGWSLCWQRMHIFILPSPSNRLPLVILCWNGCSGKKKKSCCYIDTCCVLHMRVYGVWVTRCEIVTGQVVSPTAAWSSWFFGFPEQNRNHVLNVLPVFVVCFARRSGSKLCSFVCAAFHV